MSFLALRSPRTNNTLGNPSGIATITGTIISATAESDIVAGGKTIIITLTNAIWVAAGATFDATRQGIINGLNSAQSDTNGWNAVVRATQGVAGVVRTSDYVVTITLDAFASYDISSDETITVLVPESAISGDSAIVGSPTFTITAAGGGGQSVTTPYLDDSADTFYGPTVTPGAVTITAPLLTNTNTLYAMSVAYAITTPYNNDSADTLYAPTLAVGAVTVTLPLLTNSSTLYGQTLTLNVTVPFLTNTNTLYDQNVAYAMSLPIISDSDTLYQPSVAYNIAPPYLTNSQTFYGPTLGLIIDLPFLTNTSVFYSALFTIYVSTPFITNTQTFYAVSLFVEGPTDWTRVGTTDSNWTKWDQPA